MPRTKPVLPRKPDKTPIGSHRLACPDCYAYVDISEGRLNDTVLDMFLDQHPNATEIRHAK